LIQVKDIKNQPFDVTQRKKKRPLAPQHPAFVKCCARKRTSKFRKKALTIPLIFDNIIVSIFKAKERFL
jgi:hypothetical protein